MQKSKNKSTPSVTVKPKRAKKVLKKVKKLDRAMGGMVASKAKKKRNA